MAINGELSQCLRVVVYSSLLGLVVSRAVRNTHYKEDPKNYNYHYEKSGAMLKAGGSDVPYLDSYEIDDGGYYPSDYTSAESSNFGSYDIGGGGGQYLGGGGGQYLGGGGYSGGLGGGGLNQYSNQGYSSGAGFGFGNGGGLQSGGLQGGGLQGGGLNSGFSGGYTSGVGNNYANQQGFQSGGGGGGGGYIQRPFITGGGYGGGLHGGQVGGGYVDKNQFESDNKNVGNANSQLAQGQSGGSANQGNQGVNQGAALQSSAKVDSGYYKDETANKNQQGDGKSYQGGQNFDKSGTKGDSENAQKSHKKGHVTKGFKSSHRKDEEEKTETFYDEAHDEADKKNFDQNQGAFGEKSEANFKGGQEKAILDAKSQGKEGNFNSQNKIDDSKANKGEFGQTAYKGNNENFHNSNGLGAQSLLGHQESSGQYFSNKPYGILPIHGDKK